MFKWDKEIKCQKERQNKCPKMEGSFEQSSHSKFHHAVLTTKKSLQVSPIDHMLFVLANRNVYLVTPWKIYIYYIDTEYKWGILSGILWLCCKTNCHICLTSCFTISILQYSSTCLCWDLSLPQASVLYHPEAYVFIFQLYSVQYSHSSFSTCHKCH